MLQEKEGKEIPELSRLELSEDISVNRLAFRCQRQNLMAQNIIPLVQTKSMTEVQVGENSWDEWSLTWNIFVPDIFDNQFLYLAYAENTTFSEW